MPIQTLSDLFLTAVRDKPRDDCFSTRDETGTWQNVSSADAKRRVLSLRHGLRSPGVEPGNRVAILSENRLEWILTDMACHCAGD